MVELKDFIVASLKEITEGVLKAREELRDKGALVAPKATPDSLKRVGTIAIGETIEGGVHRDIYIAEFDVAVAYTEESGQSGKLGVSVMSIGLGGSMDSKASDAQHSRVKFIVPLALPEYPKGP